MIRKLHIDVETFSSVDIMTSGAYKYCESPDFEILMVAYCYDDEPIEIIDLACGEKLPSHFISALGNPDIELHAHNANFERNAFTAIGFKVPIWRWHCSAVKSAYSGLPISLGAVSDALQLGEKGKLSTGKALIRYFCAPVKPTKVNGGRMRNFPHHDMDKWEEFKQYCINDVEAEREIGERLSHIVIPDFERENYILDQMVNDQGVMVDMEMAHAIININDQNDEAMMREMGEITNLENPNSPAQLKEWLSQAMSKEITTLAKDTLGALLVEAESGPVKRVIELRQRSSKTSVKKYAAMINCACEDEKVRGLFQFYGGSRTGRWAGRLVQLQNLPRMYLGTDQEVRIARSTMKSGDYDFARLMYDDISHVLSMLIRATFIPDPGHVFAISDYSAIEARVIAWLADEQWRQDVFATHGKIYEASASKMFNIPIEEVVGDIRMKGKVSELALGYQGGVGALKTMGGEKMGLSESEMKDIVTRWRDENENIVKLWYAVDKAAKRAVKTRKKIVLKEFKNLAFEYVQGDLTIQLPSGRKLYYREASLYENRFGTEAVRYKGVDQFTKKWGYIDSYGGKFVENIVQAISRDLLAYAMQNLRAAGFKIPMHVHDEIITLAEESQKEEKLKEMNAIMCEKVTWAPGLILTVDGFTTEFYEG